MRVNIKNSAAILAVMLAGCGQPAPGDLDDVSNELVLTNVTYTLVGVHSNKCVEAASTARGAVAQIATCNGDLRQHWRFETTDVGYYRVRNVGVSRCLDIEAASKDRGGRAILWDCGAAYNQQFRTNDLGNSVHQFLARHSSLALDVSGAGTADGTPLIQWSLGSATNQQFRLAAVGGGPANAAGYRWSTVKIGGGGFVSGIVTSRSKQSLIFARTDVGGAYRWEESTHSWSALTDWVSESQTGLLGVESIAIDPTEPNRVYMLAGISYFNGGKTAILRSSDYGNTFAVTEVTGQFKAHGNGMGRQNGERLAVDPNNGSVLLSGTRNAGLFRSTDRGATWTRVSSLGVTTTPNGNGIPFVVFDPASGTTNGATRTIYVGVSRAGQTNLYRSTDAGSSWAAVSGAPTSYLPQRASLASNGALYLTYANGAGPHGTTAEPMSSGAVYKYTIGTGTFTNITPGGVSRAFGGISVDATNPSRLVATTINTYLQQPWGWGDRIFVSTNAGASWTDLIGSGRVTMNANGVDWLVGHAIHWAGSIEFDPFNPKRVWVTSGNGVFGTDDIDANPSVWKPVVNGLEETVPLGAVSLPGGPFVSVIGDYDGFMHSDPTRAPVLHKPGMGTTTGVAFAAGNPNLLARVGARLYGSTNRGGTWSEWPRPTTETGGDLAFSANGNALLWGVGSSLRRTTNQGASWSTASGISFGAFPLADPVNSNKFYVYEPASGRVYVSTNAGQSFASTTALSAWGNRRIAAAPGIEGDVWVALYGGGLSRSTNSGSSFTRIASVSSCSAVGFGAPAPGRTYPTVFIWGAAAGGVTGVYRSIDGGASWLRVNDDAHQYGGPGNAQFVLGDPNVYGRVYLSTAGRGIAFGELAN